MSAERDAARLERKARRQDARRQQVLAAARALLEEGGASALTISALAQAADTSAPTLYYYFDSKEAVADALAVELLQEETHALRAALDGSAGGVESVVAVMQARLRFYVERPSSFSLLYGALTSLGVRPQTLQQHVYPLAALVMGELEARLRADQQAGTVHAALRPREFANVAFLSVQGILSASISMSQAGGTLLFGVDTLLAEAVAMVRRAALS